MKCFILQFTLDEVNSLVTTTIQTTGLVVKNERNQARRLQHTQEVLNIISPLTSPCPQLKVTACADCRRDSPSKHVV